MPGMSSEAGEANEITPWLWGHGVEKDVKRAETLMGWKPSLCRKR
jgi:hypothetical protein